MLTIEQLEARAVPAVFTISGIDSGDQDGVPFATANLVGTNLADSFIFLDGAYLTGSLDGGGGVDSVTFADWSDPFTFAVSDNNAGTLTGSFGSLPFASAEHLAGGQGDDTFTLAALKGLSGGLDGQDGYDTLSYAAWTTNVKADLLAGTATALGGISGIENLIGGSRDDRFFGDGNANRLEGGAGKNVLVGGGGDDTLIGGAGRDLLIGGTGADMLDGGGEDDILIGCATVYDADLASLNRIMSEWTSSRTYAQRVANITGGTGNTAGVTLTAAECLADGADDTMTGGAGTDWFFATAAEDVLSDRNGAEQLVAL